MNTNYFIDETVLATLLRTWENAWQTAYVHYREPFVRHFEKHYGLEPSKGEPLFQEAFALMVQGLREGKICTPVGQTLFAYLAALGDKKLADAGYQAGKAAIPMKLYLAGEVLVLLLRKGHEATFPTIAGHFQEPICNTLKSSYYFSKESPMEIFGEALMAMKRNVEEGHLKLPLRSRLFTYTYRIAENKFLAFNKMMKKGAPLSSLEGLERIFAEAIEEEGEDGFLDYMTELWPTLSLWLKDWEDAFECLISILDEMSKEILRLRLEEGLAYKEIGKILNLPVGTVRKRFTDILKKWKKIFFQRSILKDAESPIREYLCYYLIKRWPFSKIAAHYGRPETEIKRIIEEYHRDWRKRNEA